MSPNETELTWHALPFLWPTKTHIQEIIFLHLPLYACPSDIVLTVEIKTWRDPTAIVSASSVLKIRNMRLSNQYRLSQPFLRSQKLRLELRPSGLPNWASPSIFYCLCMDPLCWKHLLPWAQLGQWLVNIVNARNFQPMYGRVQSLSRHLMNTQTTTPFWVLHSTLFLQNPRGHQEIFCLYKIN